MSRVTPEIGMPATYCVGSDRYAMTVVAIKRNGRTVEARHGKPDESIPYRAAKAFTLRKNGRYILQGCESGTLALGVAVDYLDPSF
jgi:hypothetical protein